MIQELKSALGKVYLTIETDPENRWIFTDWQGYLTAENIKTGAKAYTDALAASGFSCVLNDTRSMRGCIGEGTGQGSRTDRTLRYRGK